MTTLGDNFKDRSTDNKLKKIQDTLEKSSKLKKAENNPMILEAGRKPSNATKQPIGKKDNLKKLTIAIANYYDSTKIVEKSGHILSSKFEETKNRNLFPAKYHSVLLGSKAESTFHSSKPGQNKTEASSGDCKVEKAKHLETQNRLVSNPHTRGLKQEREPKAESYRYFTTNEQITPSLLREKTVPKMPTMSNQEIVKHSQFHMNHITLPHNHQKNQRESASMFKACINSISQKNEGTSKQEHKKGDKPRLYLNSISSYSGKVAESILTSKSNMKTPKLEASIFKVKQSSHDQNTGNNRIKNKENRNSKAVNIQNISQEPKANHSKQLNPDRGDPNSSLQQPRNYHIFTKATINHKNINLSSEDYEHNPVKKEKTISTLSLKNTIAAGALKKVKRAINRSELDIIQQKLKNSIHNKESSYITLDNHEDQVLIDKSSSGSSRSLRCGEMMNIDIPVLSHLSADETSLKEDEGLRTEEYHPEPTNLLSDPEILKNMMLSENEYQFNPHYLSRSTTGIKWNMRAILVDWMIEVADDFGFKRSTFYLAVCNVDRYLAAAPQTNTKHLQLIGLTCLMIATKLEEIYSLTLPDWSSITLKSFTEEDIQQAELSILKVLSSH